MLKIKAIIIICIFFISINVNAKTDKYRLTYNNNPSTTISIGWVQQDGSNAKVYFSETDFGTDYEKYENSQKPTKINEYKGAKHCFVDLKDLKANTIYYFIIKDDNSTSKRFYFLTISDNPNERLSIIAGGDSRTYREPRQLANRLVAKLQPHFVIFDGDYTVRGSGEEWNNWLDDWQLTTSKDGRMIPILAVQGNHETSKDVFNVFNVPNKKIYFSLNFGGDLLHAIVLNTEIKIPGKQTDWLKKDLSENKSAIWTVASYHKPMRPHYTKKREGDAQYDNWAIPLFENGVKLVVEGDTHTCKSTWAVKPSQEEGNDEGFVRDENGMVFIGEGTWGAPVRKSDDQKSWTRDTDAISQFKWIFVDKEKIEIRTVKYKNVEEVAELTIDKMFEIPEGIDLWNPKNGKLITIKK